MNYVLTPVTALKTAIVTSLKMSLSIIFAAARPVNNVKDYDSASDRVKISIFRLIEVFCFVILC
jgi:hypothetical protein